MKVYIKTEDSMKLRKDDCIALVIDIQEKLFPFIEGKDRMVQNQLRLIGGLQALGVPSIVTEQYRKGIGPTISPIIELIGDKFEYMEKMEFSCLENEAIKERVMATGRKNIIIIGIEAHVCILQTTLDALEAGMKPVVVADCTGSRLAANRDIALGRMRSEGAVITSYESLLFELLVRSGTPEFKEISKLVK